MTSNLYVYFKASATADVAARVSAMQTELQQLAGVQGKLMRRRDNPETWMEVYEDVGDFAAFEALLDAAVDRHAVGALLRDGERRHVERFIAA